MVKTLDGLRILVVEDEFLAAMELAHMIRKLGADVVGPVGILADAQLLARQEALDGAVLDVSLGGNSSLPLAEELLARHVPIVLTTGYRADMLPDSFRTMPCLAKPYSSSDFRNMAERHFRRG